MTLGHLARAIVAHQLDRLRRHEAGTLDGADPEDLHRMRVASRRLRAALRAFRKAFPRRMHGRLVRELRWLGRTLGAVRDLDVQIERLRSPGAFPRGAPHEAGRAVLLGDLEAGRLRSRRGLIEALGGPRYRALVKALDRFARGMPSRERPSSAEAAVGEFGARALAKAAGRFRKSVEVALADPTPERLHEMRIRGKRLRYLLEFLDGAAEGAAAAPARRLARLQDLLGEHQDAIVGREIARRVLERRNRRLGDEERRGLEARIARETARAAALRDRFSSGWRRLTGPALDREVRAAIDRLGRLAPGSDPKKRDAVSGVP